MIKKTYISKSNTIIKGSKENYGLNPISMLQCGATTSRFLIDFNVDEIKEFVLENGGSENFSHILHMKNCGSVDIREFFKEKKEGDIKMMRNTSFDILIFEIPQMWDAGIGFDSSSDFWFNGQGGTSTKGSTWMNSTSDTQWEKGGIYDDEFLLNELKKFENKEESIIVATQHFDFGNENINIDITNLINNIISEGRVFNGLCFAFIPTIEGTDENVNYYTNFFNNNTGTFFKPSIKTISNKSICDDRYNFILGKENTLLLFVQIGGIFTNLDELPLCTIDNKEYPVKILKKGVYGASVKLNGNDYSSDEILTDIWSNIKINGETFDDVEMEFVTHKKQLHFNIGGIKDTMSKYTATVQGMNDSETLNPEEEREVKVYFKRNYTHNEYKLVDNAQYRIYVNDGNRELDVVEWDSIDVYSDYNTFTIKANDFVPGKYKVDIKAQIGNDIKVYKEVLCFNIKNNVTTEKL